MEQMQSEGSGTHKLPEEILRFSPEKLQQEMTELLEEKSLLLSGLGKNDLTQEDHIRIIAINERVEVIKNLLSPRPVFELTQKPEFVPQENEELRKLIERIRRG